MFNNHRTFRQGCLTVLVCALVGATGASAQGGSGAGKAPRSVSDALAAGGSRDVIVLFDDSAVQSELAALRLTSGADHDSQAALDANQAQRAALKQRVRAMLPAGEHETLRDYSHLPMAFMRLHTAGSLRQLLDQPEVVAVYENGLKYLSLSSSLPFIHQTDVAAAGMTGGGTAVAVLDTGVNYLDSAFGTCSTSVPADCCPGGNCSATPPAAPTGCRVACVHDFATSDGKLDANGHGTNVSGIVAGVAPDTKVIGLDVFTGNGAYDSDIIAAINWAIAKKSAYNIVAINMSLGDGVRYTSQCPNDAFQTPVAAARQAGILTAIAAGNENFTNGLSSPACVPAAVSVGAVYDGNIGGWNYSICTDATSAADKVVCFSNSANYLSILAPGAQVTAAGYTMFGTSQATPHIAGSVAVLKGATAFPVDTADATLARMTGTGVPVLDSKSGIIKPRIDLLAAFGNPSPTYSLSGTVTANSAGLASVSMTLTGGTITTTNSVGAYTFTGLSSGVTYTVTPSKSGYTFVPTNRAVQISGANVTGQDFAATASCSAPAVPTRVSATAGSGRVTVKWTASSGAVKYNVKRSTVSGGPYVAIASGVTTTSYVDTAVTRGKTYYYVVSAVSACGAESANSTRTSAKPR